MAAEDLTNELQALTLSEPEYLLFNPTGDKAWLKEKFEDIPRYLFRVSTPKSDGTTDAFWVKSKDAKLDRESSKEDILASAHNKQVASRLNVHLRWRGKAGDLDNFVSWTSSLLFALRYVLYRSTHSKDGSSLDRISLYIIDTNSFPKGTFLRDMDLIRAFQSYDKGLQDFEALRTRQHRCLAGLFYFGEYLSQGALKVEDKCQSVSAQAIIDQGLFNLQSEFLQPMVAKEPKLANEVIRLREVFYQNTANPQPVTTEELETAITIAQLFGPRWRLPMAANLIGLLPRQSEDPATLLAFTGASFTAEEGENCSPLKTKILAYDTLPEVQQFESIMRSVHKYTCLMKMKNYIKEAEVQLRNTLLVSLDNNLKFKASAQALDQDLPLMDASHRALLRRLDEVAYLSKVVFRALKQSADEDYEDGDGGMITSLNSNGDGLSQGEMVSR